MNQLQRIKDILYKDLESHCFGYKKKNAYDHLFGVSSLCGLFAIQRNLNVDIACIIGLFHDYSSFITGTSFDHASRSAMMTEKILKDTNIFSDEEITIITTAIKNHSFKNKIDDEYSELIKDADVLHQYLQEKDKVFSKDYQNRLNQLLSKLS